MYFEGHEIGLDRVWPWIAHSEEKKSFSDNVLVVSKEWLKCFWDCN